MLKCQELGFSSYRVGGAWQQSLRSRRQTRINQLRKVRGTINHGLLCLGDTDGFYTNCCLSWPLKKKTTTTTWVTRLLRSHSKVKSSCFLSCRSLAHRYSCDLWIAHWPSEWRIIINTLRNKKNKKNHLVASEDILTEHVAAANATIIISCINWARGVQSRGF